MKIFLLLFILTAPLFATIEQYNQFIEPKFPEFTSTFNMKDIPRREQFLITKAIKEYKIEKERYDAEFSAAMLDIIHQKNILKHKLENKLTGLNGKADQANIIALCTVIKEKDTMLYNLEMVQYQRDTHLFNHLKAQMTTILNRWIRSEINTNPRYVEQLLDIILQ